MSSAEIAHLLQQGIAAAKAGQKEEARQVLMQVVDLDERNEQAWLWLSGVVETVEDRRVCLENVLALNPDNAHARTGLQWIEQNAPPPPEEVEQPIQEEAPAGQDTCPHCSAPVPPSGTECPYCEQPLLVACPSCGQYADVQQAACPVCSQPLGDYRQGADYHLALAEAYLEGRRIDRSLAAIGYALADAPSDPQVMQQAANLYERCGRSDQAIAVYRQALEYSPNAASLYARLGALYRLQSQPAEARAMYEKAAQLKGNDPVVLTELARLNIEEGGSAEESFSLLHRAVKLDPGHAAAHLLLGDLYAARQDRIEAYKQYEMTSRLAPANSEASLEAQRKMTGLAHTTPVEGQAVRAKSGKGVRSGPRTRPGCLTIYAILVAIGGFFGALSGLGILALTLLSGGMLSETAATAAEMGLPPTFGAITTVTLLGSGGVVLVLSVLSIAIAVGLWGLKNWARIATIILQGLSMIGSIIQAVLTIGGFRTLTEIANEPLQFPTMLMCGLLLGFIIQSYIIFWFVANGDLFD